MKIASYLKTYRWLIAFSIVVAFGYQVGKDMAHRDNARDRAASEICCE
jgi:hypothetical protein